MTWREFQLRRIGYLRQEKSKWYHTRFITYHNLLSVGALKNISIEKFMPLDETPQKRVSKEDLEMLKEKQLEYFNNNK